MADRHIVVGAGPVGTETIQQLLNQGAEVTVVTRSGRHPELAGVTGIAADASDADALARITEGATALYNCANPSNYTTWEKVWPPLADSLLRAAERTGAVLATVSTLYPYGPVDVPMTPDLPDAATDHKGILRARMTAEAFTLHREGRVRAVEVRGSDYMVEGVGANGHVPRHIPAALKGKTARVVGSPDQPHTWTDVRDVARTIVAAATTESAWGQVWHVPSNEPRTQRQAINDVLAVAGKPYVDVRPLPGWAMKAVGKVHPLSRELMEMSYQFERPYVLDSSRTEAELGLKPTPWDEICRRTLNQPGGPR